MATSARIGHGTLFAVGDGSSPEVFTAVAEVTSITLPGVTRDLIDSTHMEQATRFRQFIVGNQDGGEAKLEMNFIPGGPGQELIADLQIADDPSNIRITFVNGNIWAFAAYCTGYEPTAPVDDKMTASASFKVTGAVDFGDPPLPEDVGGDALLDEDGLPLLDEDGLLLLEE